MMCALQIMHLKGGCTPLHLASAANHLKTTSLLLSSGASLKAVSSVSENGTMKMLWLSSRLFKLGRQKYQSLEAQAENVFLFPICIA